MTEQQREIDDAEERFARSVVERGLTEELIRSKPPMPKDLTAVAEFAKICRDQGITPFPASPWIVAAHLLCLICEGRSAAEVTRASAALDHAHDVNGVSPPGGHSAVKAVLKLNRTHSRKPNKEVHH